MQVTITNFRTIQNAGALRAACRVELATDDREPIMDINSVKVVDGSRGLFVTMPSEKSTTTDKWYPLVYLRSERLIRLVSDEVLAMYAKMTAPYPQPAAALAAAARTEQAAGSAATPAAPAPDAPKAPGWKF